MKKKSERKGASRNDSEEHLCQWRLWWIWTIAGCGRPDGGGCPHERNMKGRRGAKYYGHERFTDNGALCGLSVKYIGLGGSIWIQFRRISLFPVLAIVFMLWWWLYSLVLFPMTMIIGIDCCFTVKLDLKQVY